MVALPWPMRPNWREPYRVGYTFSTEIITSRSGREQRIARRQTPRKTLEFLITGVRESRQQIDRLLARQGEFFWVPETPTAVRLTGAVASGGVVLPVSEVPDWAVPGTSVFLIYGDRIRLRTVAGTGAGTITVAEPSVNPWEAGARVALGVLASMPAEVSSAIYLPSVEEMTAVFEEDPGSGPVLDPGEPEETWNGREVFNRRADWATPRQRGSTRDIRAADFGVGRRRLYLPSAYNTRTLTGDYIARTAAEARGYLNFFLRQRGQQGEFYLPTDFADITLAEPTGNGFMFVEGTDFAGVWAGHPVNKAISVKLRDGTRFYRAVAAITVQGQQSRIQLDQAVPSYITPSDVEVISWLPVTRLASDELVIEWLTDQAARVRLNYRTVESLPAE